MSGTHTNDLKLFTPPHAGLTQTAEMEERKLCSLMLKFDDCLAEAAKDIKTPMFWNEPCAEMFHVCELYYREHKKRVGPDTFRSMVEKVAKPESVVGAMQFYSEVWALPVTDNEYPWLKRQITGRHLQRQGCSVLDEFYQKLMTAQSGHTEIVRQFVQKVASIDTLEGTAPGKFWTAAEIMTTEFPPMDWIWEGILPAKGLNMLFGSPKFGKSLLTLTIARRCASQGKHVLVLSLEDTPGRIQKRLQAQIGDGTLPDGITFRTTAEGWVKLDCGGLEMLDRYLDNNPLCKVVIVDTLQKIKAKPQKGDTAYGSDSEGLFPLHKLAARRGIMVLVIHHTNKQKEKSDFMDTINGSNGQGGVADNIICVTRKRGELRAIAKVTGRDVEEREFGIVFDPDTLDWTIEKDTFVVPADDTETAIKEVLEQIQPATWLEIKQALDAEGTKITDGALKMRLGRLVRGYKIDRSPKHRYSLSVCQEAPQLLPEEIGAPSVTGVTVLPSLLALLVTGNGSVGSPEGVPVTPVTSPKTLLLESVTGGSPTISDGCGVEISPVTPVTDTILYATCSPGCGR